MWVVYIHSLIGIDNYADEMNTEIRNPNQQKCPRGNTTQPESFQHYPFTNIAEILQNAIRHNLRWMHFEIDNAMWLVISYVFTYWGRNKMAMILQTTFKNIYLFKSLWIIAIGVTLIISQHWFYQIIGAEQVSSHYWTNGGVVYLCIYVPLGFNELNVIATRP